MRSRRLEYEFVEYIPVQLESGKLYVAMDLATAVHLCSCGCRREVVTPLSPTDWKLQYDGVSVSLSPSIGNWSFPCRSHYWIVRNEIRWAGSMSAEEIESGRSADRRAKGEYYRSSSSGPGEAETQMTPGFWGRLAQWIGQKLLGRQ